MTTYIAIQNTYHQLEIALLQNEQVCDMLSTDKKDASRDCVPLLQQLLSKNNCSLSDVSFIAANQGPGPFTTLRVVIATVNGIGFATNIPLIGVDGLRACLNEFQKKSDTHTVILLNAFNKEVYYAIKAQNSEKVLTGYGTLLELQDLLLQHCPTGQIHFAGNGILLHQKAITEIFGTQAVYDEPIPEYCSIAQIGRLGFAQWQNKTGLTKQILPLYLKQHVVERTSPTLRR